ncbi:MAG: glycogen synthase GlgA [Sphaerochaetaceae bacterium]|nr:glycogen synthase GlgA [Sphaerochaetaceae bacterium]
MNVLMITSEAVPFSKSGGLADVVGALTPALISKGHDARIIVPSYNTTPENSGELVCTLEIEMLKGKETVQIRQRNVGKAIYYFVCHTVFNDRLGIYGDTSFTPYSDNFFRFSLLGKAALQLCETLGWKPDILHCHDWCAGLVPYFLKVNRGQFFMGTKAVFTIHNLAYQGTFSRMDFLYANVRPDEKLFSNGQVNMLQAGLVFSDYITTVSPTYAKEIQTPGQGCGLDPILVRRKNRLKGIVNGIDTDEWNPQKDALIDHHFSIGKMQGKAKLKKEIQEQFGLPVRDDVPLFAMISRLASQKGFDAVAMCLEDMLREMDIQFIIIGTGDTSIETKFKEMAERNENLSVNILFSNKAAHLVEAGSDFFLMPSRYEPCGLNQLYSLRYGTIPIARRTGGLADTIIDVDKYPDLGTGLLFDDLNPYEIVKHVHRATELYARTEGNNSLTKIRQRAMEQDFSWSASADEYISVFSKLTEKTGGKK